MKKTVTLFLTLVMIFAAFGTWSATAAEIAQTPTPISTVAEFEAMEQFGNYYLTGDIDFGGKEYTTAYIVSKFDGILDGKGHSIYNFSFKSTENADSGIFQFLETGYAHKN